MTHLKRITAALLAIVALVFVALLLLLGVGPRFGDYRTATVLTGSMRPNMPEGSLIVQTPLPMEQLEVGDVITYRIPVQDRRIVTHRVVEILEGGAQPVVRTRGDANNADDPWVARLQGEHTWEVRGVVPKAGYVVQWLRSDLAQQFSMLLVPVALCLLWLRAIWSSAPGSLEPDVEDVGPVPAVAAPRTPVTIGSLLVLLLLGRHVARSRVA